MSGAAAGVLTVVDRARAEIAPHRTPALVAAGLAGLWALWVSGPGWPTPAVVVAALAGGVLGVIDARTHRLPNAITYPATAVVAVLLTVAAAGTGSWAVLGRAGVGALALAAFYLVLHLVNRAGMGLGDVKLAVLLGGVSAWFGWPVVAGALFLPFFVGGVAAVVLIVARQATRKSAIPFGPAMLAGTALAITWPALFGV
jgi:leader peptidase (prepilin peptidase)/N-methyltransferase